MYIAEHHTHKAGGSRSFHVPGTHAIHNKDGKYLPAHSTVTLSVIVKLEAVCVVTSLIPRPSVVTSLIIYKCESTVIVAKFRYVCV